MMYCWHAVVYITSYTCCKERLQTQTHSGNNDNLTVSQRQKTGGETKYYINVVALFIQFLDKKEKDEPMMTIEEQPADYEA